jgi:hypothetical protein
MRQRPRGKEVAMSKMLSTAVFLSVAVVSVPAVAADPSAVCGPRKEIMKQLSQSFSEAPTAIGVTSTGELLQVLASADKSTWTIVVSRPDGLSCIVAAGADWQEKHDVAQREQEM